jgi:hypothetical protein
LAFILKFYPNVFNSLIRKPSLVDQEPAKTPPKLQRSLSRGNVASVGAHRLRKSVNAIRWHNGNEIPLSLKNSVGIANVYVETI